MVLGPRKSAIPLVRVFSEHDEILHCEIKYKKINVSNDLSISLLSYDEVSAFMLLSKARSSSLFTGR